MSSKESCKACGKYFSNLCGLRRHIRKVHPEKLNELAPLKYKNKSNYRFSCDKCSKNFNIEQQFRYHLKSHEEVEKPGNIKSKLHLKKCPLCSFSTLLGNDMLKHFEQVHDIIINSKDMEFISLSDFEQWLLHVKKETQSVFIKTHTKTSKCKITVRYTCQRSGVYVPKGKGLRLLKVKGSVKINGFCPASIKLVQNSNGTYNVHYIETHVGHSSDSNFTKRQRQRICRKMKNLQSRHIASIALDLQLVTTVEYGWEVKSEKNQETYLIERFNEKCSCHLICSDCNICLHRYCCSCKDSSIRSNMCKHIHLLARWRKLHNVPDNSEAHQNIDDDLGGDKLFMHINNQQTDNEADVILKRLSKKRPVNSMDKEKEVIKKRFCDYVDAIQSPTKLEIIKNFVTFLEKDQYVLVLRTQMSQNHNFLTIKNFYLYYM